MMNSPFVIEQAQAVAARPAVTSASDPPAQVRALYRLVLSREPDEGELAIGSEFLAAAAAEPAETMKLTPLVQFAQLLLLTNEVMYVD
jgi:hypothetical protein